VAAVKELLLAAAVHEKRRGAQGGALIPAPAGPSNVPEQRATLGLRVCTRLACSRAFEPRRSGGRPQEFYAAFCRRRFNDEARRQARARWRPRIESPTEVVGLTGY